MKDSNAELKKEKEAEKKDKDVKRNKVYNILSDLSKKIKTEEKVNVVRIIINCIFSIFILGLIYFVVNNYEKKYYMFYYLTIWTFFLNGYYIVSVTAIDLTRLIKNMDYCIKYNNFVRKHYIRICFPFSISIVFLYWMLILLGDDFEYRGRDASDTAVGLFFHGIILIFLFFDVFTAKHKHLKNYFWDILILNILIAAYFLLLGIGKYIIEYEPYDFMEVASVRQIVGACVLIYISIMDGYVIINLLANQFFDNDINDSKLKSNFINNYGEIVPIKGNIIEKYDMTNEKRDINLFNNSIKANNEVNAEIDNNTWESIN